MKGILFIALMLLTIGLQAQLLNGSFEADGQPTLAHWQSFCPVAESLQEAPDGGGNWSVKVVAGNFQGCFPGYFYQTLPEITDGSVYQLKAWVRDAQGLFPRSIFLGKINADQEITLFAGDTTSSGNWTELQVIDTFQLSAGDTAAVILHAGQTSGPDVFGRFGQYDNVRLQLATVVNNFTNTFIKIFPNPLQGNTLFIEFAQPLSIQKIILYNASGKIIFQKKQLAAKKTQVVQLPEIASGIYFLQFENDGSKVLKKIIKAH